MLHMFWAGPAFFLAFLLLGFCALLSLTVLARRRLGKSTDRVVRSIVWLVAIVVACVGTFSSILVGRAIVTLDLAHAKEFAEELVPLLESYHTEHDAYPASLAEIADLSDTPRLVGDGDLQYEGGVYSYRFEITVKDGFGWAGWTWTSSDPRWTYWRD